MTSTLPRCLREIGMTATEGSRDKATLLVQVMAQVEAKLAELRAGYGAAREAVLSTPHVMKSKREVFGQESAYLANALALNIREREYELKVLRALRLPESPERAALGCVVGVGALEGTIDGLYLILPVCGGMEITAVSGGVPVRVVTPATPIARALLGKSLDDEVTLPGTPPRCSTVRLLR
jgi:transcription elongation GreA/GreB family factor